MTPAQRHFRRQRAVIAANTPQHAFKTLLNGISEAFKQTPIIVENVKSMKGCRMLNQMSEVINNS